MPSRCTTNAHSLLTAIAVKFPEKCTLTLFFSCMYGNFSTVAGFRYIYLGPPGCKKNAALQNSKDFRRFPKKASFSRKNAVWLDSGFVKGGVTRCNSSSTRPRAASPHFACKIKHLAQVDFFWGPVTQWLASQGKRGTSCLLYDWNKNSTRLRLQVLSGRHLEHDLLLAWMRSMNNQLLVVSTPLESQRLVRAHHKIQAGALSLPGFAGNALTAAMLSPENVQERGFPCTGCRPLLTVCKSSQSGPRSVRSPKALVS